MTNGGDKPYHDEKPVGRKDSKKQPKKGAVDRKQQSTTKQRA